MKGVAFFAKLLLAVSLLATTARADGGDAEGLFVQGNALVAEGRYAEACPKLAESDRLEPAIGTRFNLADCYEHLGRAATAHALFLDVARLAHASGKFERERLARARAAAIAPKLGRLRLDVRSTARGLEIQLDDAVLPRAKWRDEHLLDPGPHTVTAIAPGLSPFRGDAAANAGSTIVVTVPELTPPPPTTAESPVRATATATGSGRRSLALALGGVGVAGLVVGGVAGAIALSSRGRAEELCPRDTYQFRCPSEAGASEWSAASTAGNVATVGFVAGGVMLAAAAIVWLTAPSAKTSARLGAWSF